MWIWNDRPSPGDAWLDFPNCCIFVFFLSIANIPSHCDPILSLISLLLNMFLASSIWADQLRPNCSRKHYCIHLHQQLDPNHWYAAFMMKWVRARSLRGWVMLAQIIYIYVYIYSKHTAQVRMELMHGRAPSGCGRCMIMQAILAHSTVCCAVCLPWRWQASVA